MHPDAWEHDYRVMVEATRAYFRKTGFGRAVLGLSGGRGQRARSRHGRRRAGAEAVRRVMLPSEYPFAHSLEDAVDAVKAVERPVYVDEWKRFQSPPGARLTGRAFWLDRRHPIVNRWRDPG